MIESIIQLVIAINELYGPVGVLAVPFLLTGWIIAGFFGWKIHKNSKLFHEERKFFQREVKDARDQLAIIIQENTKVITQISERFEILQTLLVQLVSSQKSGE